MKGCSSRGTWHRPAGNSSLSCCNSRGENPLPPFSSPFPAIPAAAAAPSPPGGERRTRSCPLNPWDLPSTSTLEFHHSGLPWSLEHPKKAARDPPPTPPPPPGTSRAPCRAPHLPGQVGRAGRAPTGTEGGSQPCSIREFLNSSSGQRAKSSAWLFLGGRMEERTGGGNSQGWGFLPVFVYLLFPVWRILSLALG